MLRAQSLPPYLRYAGLCALALAAGCASPGPYPPPLRPLPELISERIAIRLERTAADPDSLDAREDLQVTYGRARMSPLWVTEAGVRASVFDVLGALQRSKQDGFNPEDYHYSEIVSALKIFQEDRLSGRTATLRLADRLAALDLMISDAFASLIDSMRTGRVDPEEGDPEWHIDDDRVRAGAAPRIEDAARGADISAMLASVEPADPGYRRLRETLNVYREISANGGWPKIPEGKKLRSGNEDRRVPKLRRRLAMTGDLLTYLPSSRGPASAYTYDDALSEAVRRFQERHGLPADGVLGHTTIEEMNVPVEYRIQQIEANMERWRWLPQHLAERSIQVNIPDYRLDVVEHGKSLLAMAVVVGQEVRRTPEFASTLKKMVLNPNWFVPKKLALEDLLPKFKRDAAHMKKRGFRVFEQKEEDFKEVDPLSVDWTHVDEKNFHYMFMQRPGPQNALGEIKFMPPNPFHIYLHGTPTKQLFKKNVRTASSGCIRIESPLDLAEVVMRGTEWDRLKLIQEILSGTNRSLKLPRPIKVYLMYWTAWVDADGRVNFRRDVYGRDHILDYYLHPPAG